MRKQINLQLYLIQFFIICNIRMKSVILVLIISTTLGATVGHLIQFQNTQPHNRNCYSQGLFFLNQTHLFETCGLYNQSYFHILEYNADPFQITEVFTTDIPWKLNIFLEGAILFKNFIYVLTWVEHVVYKLDPQTYKVVKEIPWRREGWGLTHNQTHMFTTDGSDNIFLVDENFEVIGQKAIVTQMGRRLRNINELEYVDGFIYANIYLDSKIVKIDYQRGKSVEEYDGSKIIRAQRKTGVLRGDQVINGIAYDKKNDKFLLTGKHWGSIYQVSL